MVFEFRRNFSHFQHFYDEYDSTRSFRFLEGEGKGDNFGSGTKKWT